MLPAVPAGAWTASSGRGRVGAASPGGMTTTLLAVVVVLLALLLLRLIGRVVGLVLRLGLLALLAAVLLLAFAPRHPDSGPPRPGQESPAFRADR